MESSVTDGYGRVGDVQRASKDGARPRWWPNSTSTVTMASRPKGATMCDKVCNLNNKKIKSILCINFVVLSFSGDCGMFAIKYVEHILVDAGFDTLLSENMRTFRKKWSTDLFFQLEAR